MNFGTFYFDSYDTLSYVTGPCLWRGVHPVPSPGWWGLHILLINILLRIYSLFDVPLTGLKRRWPTKKTTVLVWNILLQKSPCFDIWYLELHFSLRLLCQREKSWQGLNPLTSNFLMRLPRKTQVEPAGRESDGTIDSPRKTQAETRREANLRSQMVEFIHQKTLG